LRTRSLLSLTASGWCDVVWAELAAVFPSKRASEEALSVLSAEFLPMEQKSAALAGEMWRQYRSRGGGRARVIPDFLISAHAQLQCDRLLTRDRGFCRDYFKKLRVIDPSA
jgi:predicted nucleic acid-binding protein